LGNSNVHSGSYFDAAAAEFVLPAIFLRDGMRGARLTNPKEGHFFIPRKDHKIIAISRLPE
jgi:hypothetical protein